MEQRMELFKELQPLVTTFDQHPWNWAEHEAGQRTPRAAMASRWNADKDLSFIPLRPERVLEVRYDHMEGPRFRHTAQFVRWRPDREPRSCTFAQLEEPVSFNLDEILRGRSSGAPSPAAPSPGAQSPGAQSAGAQSAGAQSAGAQSAGAEHG
jgi:hypothetical protein